MRSIARWPALLQPWLNTRERQASALPNPDPRCKIAAGAVQSRMRIEGAIADAVIRRAPGSTQPPTLSLRALGADDAVDWLINGRLVGSSHGASPLRWRFEQPGEQAIVALARNGRYDRVVIQVLP